ncbi:MAG: hypothetical protein K2P63_13825 [Lachnospiraceae bacterium]|nr:hypothetical protein [Lachnospiraceae bacterium]
MEAMNQSCPEWQAIAYRNEDVTAKAKELLTVRCSKVQEWQDFILSDAFLAVYEREGFVGELLRELSACKEIGMTRLEPAFLSELTLVYGIVSFDDIGNYDRGNKAAVGNLLLEQEHMEWLDVRPYAQRVSLRYSFYSFHRLCQMAKRGAIRDYQQEDWGSLSFYAEDNYTPEAGVEEGSAWQLRMEYVTEPYAPACVAMHRFLVRHYAIPEQVCHRMRSNFEIDGRLGKYELCSYQEAYDAMCQSYPDMRQSEEARFTEWKLALLSDRPVFTKRGLDAETQEWLRLVWKVRECSEELTKEVYDAYKDEGGNARLLQETLIRCLTVCRNQSIDCVGGDSWQVSLQNPCFWSYFMGAAYPYTNDGRRRKESDYHFALSLYMKQVYPVSAHFVRQFFRKETRAPRDSMHYVLQAGKQECTISFGGEALEKQVRMVFTPHHVEYYIQEESVYYQILSFAELSALPDSAEGNLTFFLLLPITKVSADGECRSEVMRRLQALPFYAPSWEYLADCMVRNTDWETVPDHPQKQLEEVYYSEDAWHCFRGRLTGRKFTVEYKTPRGWHPMSLLHGESKNIRAIVDKTERMQGMHAVVDGFLPPEPKFLGVRSVSEEELWMKARDVVDGMFEARDWLGINFTLTLWFRENDVCTPRLCYLFWEDSWTPDSLQLEITGEQKHAYLNREGRMKRVIGEQARVVGYFRIEGMLPFPVGVAKSGTFYTYFDHHLVAAQSYPQLIQQCVNLETLDKIEIYDGLRTVDLFTRKLENWYMHRYDHETKEHECNYPSEIYKELFQEM